MKIQAGLFPHMVLQRDGKAAQDAAVLGSCAAKGAVVARAVRPDGVPIRGWAARRVGTADGRSFRATLAGLPVGGPYDITLVVGGESLAVPDVLVGDVWICAGQSNMQGCGHFPKKRLGREPLVRAFYMDDHWDVAQDPVHALVIAVDPVHTSGTLLPGRPLPPYRGVSPAVAFGQEMLRLTGIPQGLLACAHGGTSMSQWDPKLKKMGGHSLYGATFRRLGKNYPSGKVAGLLWYQGCNDANPDLQPFYKERTIALFKAFRRDLRAPGLPIAMVQIGNFVVPLNPKEKSWTAVRDDQRRICLEMEGVVLVPAYDLELDEEIHLSGEAQYQLGRRLASALRPVGRTDGKRLPAHEIRLAGIAAEKYEDGRLVLIASFDNVVGSLVAAGRPTGFSVALGGDDRPGNVTNVHLDGNRVRILTTLNYTEMEYARATLHYAYGFNTYANVTDEEGRPLPAFSVSPIPPARPDRVATAFATPPALAVSGFVPAARDLSDIAACPRFEALPATDRPTLSGTGAFIDLHVVLSQRRGREEALFFRTRFVCDGDWNLKLLLGYDGPVKVWIDGAEVFRDPDGRCPAFVDKAQADISAGAGTHELVVALSTNLGTAWGIFLRLARHDIPRREYAGGNPPVPRFVE